MGSIAPIENETKSIYSCDHCGEVCKDQIITSGAHHFCCEGCELVYDILKQNDLCQYYNIEGAKGISPDPEFYEEKFDYLNLPDVAGKLIEFTDGKMTAVNWLFPKMHCSSCIWLLEHLYRLNPAIRSSVVNFPEKKVRITFDQSAISLSALATLLTRVGYEPYLSLEDLEGKQKQRWNRVRIYKIGIAGFVFGNIMMLSFPEYFHLGQSTSDKQMRLLFSWLNFALSLPVLFYCAAEFFQSAWAALRGRYFNIDAPLALAMLSTYAISLYQFITQTGPGYFDSFTGAAFFLLIGRYFQDKTYASITFDRDYKSYFPVAVTVLQENMEAGKPITELKKEDRILVRNEELIPVDAVLKSPKAWIDYSFVSGEAEPVERFKGDTIYSGGKQKGTAIELEVLRSVSQSYLTQLWNNEAFNKQKEDANQTLASRLNRYFSLSVLGIAVLTCLIWLAVFKQPETAFLAFTTTLLVACPCALVLSSTFTNGNLLGLFGKNKMYPKNAFTIERLAKIDTVVFDKTGTITLSGDADIEFRGRDLTQDELIIIKTITSQSAHPLSRLIARHLTGIQPSKRVLSDFEEIPGKGMQVSWGKSLIKIGSAKWVNAEEAGEKISGISKVFIVIDDTVAGYFSIKSKYRPALAETLAALKKANLQSHLLSGDKPTDTAYLANIFGSAAHIYFEQNPQDKLDFIQFLQKQGRHVMMVGDGLNDAGALRQSDVGLAVSDDINNFSPACDAIVEGKQLSLLPNYIKLAKAGQRIIKQSFAISLMYNVTGLTYAVTGSLSPVIAAILMPVSSITIVAFTTLATRYAFRVHLRK